jgi:hypothetical protein
MNTEREHPSMQDMDPEKKAKLEAELDAVHPTKKAAKAKAEKPSPAPAKEAKPSTDAEESRSKEQYAILLARVKELKAMTDTREWQRLYGSLRAQVKGHAEALLDAEGNRDIIHHQEAAKIIRAFVASVKSPVTELNNYIGSMPLFSANMKTRAEWNDALGIVEMRG